MSNDESKESLKFVRRATPETKDVVHIAEPILFSLSDDVVLAKRVMLVYNKLMRIKATLKFFSSNIFSISTRLRNFDDKKFSLVLITDQSITSPQAERNKLQGWRRSASENRTSNILS